jgi:hypothetical protein
LEWVIDKVLASFGRHHAPVLHLYDTLNPGEVVFVLSGLIPNRKAQPLLHRWFGVTFKYGEFVTIEDFEGLLDRTELGQQTLPNRNQDVDIAALQARL